MEKKNKIKFDVKTAQINAQRKKERRNTIYAWILLVLFVFWTIGSVLSFVNTFAGCSTSSTGYISAKADEGVAETALTGDEMNGTIRDFDITNYPSANYFNIENYKGDNSGWITVSNGVVNSIVIVATENTVYGVSLGTTLAEFCPELIAGETYTLSFELSSDLARNAIRLNSSGNSAGVYWYNGQSRTIDASDLSSSVYLYPLLSPGVMPDEKCVWSSIMINKGTEAMPYFPYYKTLYDTGYNEGVTDGTGSIKSSFFFDCYAWGYLEDVELDDGTIIDTYYTRTFMDFDYIYGGIDVSSFALALQDELFEKYGQSAIWSKSVFSLGFKSKVLFPAFNVGATGNSSSFLNSVEVFLDSNYFFDFSWRSLPSSVNEYALEIPSSISSEFAKSTVSRMFFEIGGGADGLDFTLYDSKSGYYLGFDEGYDFGYNNGYGVASQNANKQIKDLQNQVNSSYNDGFNAGKDIGYTDGFGAGKIEGAATANDYSFMSLISATIDAPIQAFTKMFDFEILGVNLTNFFLSLLSVGIVLVVLKLIFGGA